jgi:hypothetical protein
MKTKLLLQLLLVSCIACPILAENPPKPQVSPNPVDADSLAIYRDFLKSYDNGSGSSLNISELTAPFQPEESDRKGCLSEFPSSEFGSTTVHRFAADTFPPPNKLVDPQKHKIYDPGSAIRGGQPVDDAVERGFAAGLFTFSEVAFNPPHTHAALSFSFHCGMLCGHGATLIYEKQNGVWKRTVSRCSQWVS